MFTDPVKNLKFFGLGEDMLVADFGAGTGFYSIPAARMTPRGKVYAIEIQKDFLQTITNKKEEAKLNNLECLWGDVEKIGGTKIKDELLDAVLISNIFCQVEDREKMIKEAFRVLKKKGRVLLVELCADSVIVGKKNNTCISKDQSRVLFEKQGFVYERDIDAGDHHYGMIFRKQ